MLLVLKMVKSAGYNLIFITSDNNSTNRKLYEKLGSGCLNSVVKNPVSCTEDLFLLFDTVHLLKTIRNNWLSPFNQTFFILVFEYFYLHYHYWRVHVCHEPSNNDNSDRNHLKVLYSHELNNM